MILNNFVSQEKGFQPPKNTKKYNFEYNGYNVCLTKAKVRGLALFIRNNQIQILPKISGMSKIKTKI